jgi:hypothetical protein
METVSLPLRLAAPKACVCCGDVRSTTHRSPLCEACVAPEEIRSYCAKCGTRGVYPLDDFIRVMMEHHPQVEFRPGMVVRLPACAACNQDGRPPEGDGVIRFYGIDASATA